MRTWVLSMKKVLLISAGVVSLAMGLNFSAPIAVNGIPATWSVVLSWLKPPYLYIIINAIIITVAASSRFHQSQSEPPTIRFEDFIPPPSSFESFSAQPDVRSVVAETATAAAAGVVVSDFEDPVVQLKPVTVSVSEVDNETEEETVLETEAGDVFVGSTLRNNTLPQEKISQELQLEPLLPVMEKEKPLVSSMFGHRKPNRVNPEGEGALRLSMRKRQERRHVPLMRDPKNLVNVSSSTGSQVEIPELDKSCHPNLSKAGDVNGKSDIVVPSAAASNGLLVSSPRPVPFTAASSTTSANNFQGSLFATASKSVSSVLFTAASSNDANHISRGTASLLTSSTSSANNLQGSLFATASKSGSSVLFTATSSNDANHISRGTASLFTSSTSSANNLQGSLFATASKSVSSVLFTAASSNDTNHIFSGSVPLFTSSTRCANNLQGSLFATASKSNPSVLFTAASDDDTNHISRGSVSLFTSSTGTANNVQGSLFATVSKSVLSVLFSTASSNDTNHISRTSASLFTCYSTSSANNLQGSLFATASKSGSSVSLPLFNMNSTDPSINTVSSLRGISTFDGSGWVSSAINSVSSNSAPSNVFSSDWQSPKSCIFGSPSPSTSATSTLSRSSAEPQASPVMLGGQQDRVAPQNPSPFQASSTLDSNIGGSFKLDSGGGDKSWRKSAKINRNKIRKK